MYMCFELAKVLARIMGESNKYKSFLDKDTRLNYKIFNKKRVHP